MIRVLLAMCGLVAVLWTFDAPHRSMVENVKNGTSVLVCNDRTIAPDMVMDMVDGVWIFKNGSMRNCHVD